MEKCLLGGQTIYDYPCISGVIFQNHLKDFQAINYINMTPIV